MPAENYIVESPSRCSVEILLIAIKHKDLANLPVCSAYVLRSVYERLHDELDHWPLIALADSLSDVVRRQWELR
jgi:hypothetical protein